MPAAVTALRPHSTVAHLVEDRPVYVGQDVLSVRADSYGNAKALRDRRRPKYELKESAND